MTTINLTLTVPMAKLVCPDCSGVFAITQDYYDQAKALGEFKRCWTCPYCKTERGFGEGTQKLRIKELESALTSVRQSLTHAHERAAYLQTESDHFRKSRDGVKGNLQKLKKRITNGVCPCCKRSFVSLAAHMRSQHPEYPNEQSNHNQMDGGAQPRVGS